MDSKELRDYVRKLNLEENKIKEQRREAALNKIREMRRAQREQEERGRHYA